jgi:hypothetical protein
MSGHILTTETDMGTVASDPPPDVTTAETELDCTELTPLNDYLKEAEGVADELVNQMQFRLTSVIVFKAETAGYVSQAQVIAADWVTEIQSVNDSFSASIDAILSNELIESTNTVTAASLVTSALSGVTLETPEDELSLLLAQARIDLNTAKEYLAETISYKNDVDSRVDEVSIAVAFQVSTQEDLVENKKGICEIRKADAILKQDELLEGWTDLEALYRDAHTQQYWSVYDTATQCWIAPAVDIDLSAQWLDGLEHRRSAEKYINNV